MRSGAAKFSLPVVLAFLAVAVPGSPARQDMSVIVQTPPMGWNSWDAWGYTIDETQFRDSVTWFHNNLQRFSSVSYTHLDVYKRQNWEPASARCGERCSAVRQSQEPPLPHFETR